MARATQRLRVVRQRLAAIAAERRHLRQTPRELRALSQQVRRSGLTFCTPSQLASLARLAVEVEQRGEAGLIVEAGCARGGSAILMCAAKAPGRPMRIYDVFGMIPPPSEGDGPDMVARYETIRSGQAVGPDGETYYAYEADLEQQVRDNFQQFGYAVDAHAVSLIRGKCEDTVKIDEAVCLAHIDVDWHQPVTACLEQIVPNLTRYGAVVIHAYNDWSGCRRATDEYFDRVGRAGFVFDDSPGHLVIRRR